MSTYTLRGSEALDVQISRHLDRIIQTVSPHCEAVILIGGYGRGDGTPFIHPDESQSPFNDYDLVVIVESLDAAVRNRFKALEKTLTEEIGLPVDLCPYAGKHLPRCEFSLLNYEMKYGHRVLWGDEQILAALPDYPHNAIPLSEGTRLLMNRGKLLLDIRQRLAGGAPASDAERIQCLKFMSKAWLSMGDSALLSERKYDISYEEKRKRIVSIGAVPHRATVIDEYLRAIELRNWGDYPSRLQAMDIPAEFERVRTVFLDFFPWYRKHHRVRECSIFKAMALNLKWNRWPYLSHPRSRLYDALTELLQDHPDKLLLGRILSCSTRIENRFRELQTRFS